MLLYEVLSIVSLVCSAILFMRTLMMNQMFYKNKSIENDITTILQQHNNYLEYFMSRDKEFQKHAESVTERIKKIEEDANRGSGKMDDMLKNFGMGAITDEDSA